MVEHERTGIVDLVTHKISRIAMWMTPFVVSIMMYEVVLRYLFENPTLWVNEMSLWVAGGIYLTAGLYVMQQRGHIRIFLLYDVVPRWLQRVFDSFSALCIAIFAACVIWGGFGEAYTKLMRWETFGTAWDPPIPATMKPLILITVVLISIQTVSNLIQDWNRGREVEDVLDEVDIDVEEIKADS